MDSKKKEDPEYHNINKILDRQDKNTEEYEIDYLCDGTETVTYMNTNLHPGYGAVPPTYSNVTITSAGIVAPPGTGPYTINASHGTSISPWVSSSSSGELQLSGENADVIINGKSLGRAIAKIEERLNLLVPNPELEKEWAELKQLGNKYRALEQQINDKMKTWKLLNK